MKDENKKILDKCFDKKFADLENEPQPPASALVVFNNGCSCIDTDDGCYVIKNYVNEKWVQSAHVFKEALKNLKMLPSDPRDAQAAQVKHSKK